jgi:bifunctional DNA-binding transcriptional regulator/antitoxin component of YhaV-PrlF toxin-antitoxin module
MPATIAVETGGKITLPDTVRDRYRLAPDTPVRLVETRSGILLVPLTDEPMSDALAQELAEWQLLGASTLDLFPYNEDKPA